MPRSRPFRPPQLNELSLLTPLTAADARSNLDNAMSRLRGVWGTHFETNLNEPAHLPMIGGLDENEFTIGCGLRYPPLQKVKGYATEAGHATASTTRSMALAHTSATVTHHTFFQQYSLVWDLFISCKSAYINWDFFTSEYNQWTQEKRSIWFTLLVETVAYYLMWQMMLGKKGLRFLCLGKDGCDVWPHILAASHQLAKDALSMTENNTASIYTVEISTGSHPSAALPGNFLAIENRRALDQALTTVHRETLGRDGRVDQRGNVVGITHYADTCPGSQNISPEREREMRRDVLKRVGGYDGPANWELGRPLTEEEKQAELIWTKRGSYITRLGNEMQKQYETPFAKMSFKDLQAIFIAKMTEQGNNSAATIDGEARGVHVRMQGEGAGEVLTMSMSDRGLESAATIDGEARGVHVRMQGEGAGEVLTMSMSDRGLESAATIDGEARGVHVKRNGVGAGEVLTMSMSDRGEDGGTASGEARRIKDDRNECKTEGCRRIQKTMTNPLCKQCSKEENKKRKNGEIEKEINRCVMCGKTEDEGKFSTKAYCQKCYKSKEGKAHRAAKKKETKVQCDEPGCERTAEKGGKCQTCYRRIG